MNIEYLQRLLQEKHWSLGKLALKTGLSRSFLCRLLHGQRDAGPRTMRAILHAFPEADPALLFYARDVASK